MLNPYQAVMKRFTIPFLFLIMLPVVSVAQYNPLTEENPSVSQIPGPPPNDVIYFEPKSEKTAKMLTVAVPSAAILIGSVFRKSDFGFTMIATGVVFGPSVGNLYAENFESVVKGISLRAGGIGLMAVGVYLGLFEFMFAAHVVNGERGMGFWPKTLIYGGAGVVIYSWIYDYFKSAENVRKYNGEYKKPFLTLSPTYFPKEKAAGISVSLSF